MYYVHRISLYINIHSNVLIKILVLKSSLILKYKSRIQFRNSNQPLFSIEFSSLNTLMINRSWSLNPKHFCLTFTLFFKSGETYT